MTKKKQTPKYQPNRRNPGSVVQKPAKPIFLDNRDRPPPVKLFDRTRRQLNITDAAWQALVDCYERNWAEAITHERAGPRTSRIIGSKPADDVRAEWAAERLAILKKFHLPANLPVFEGLHG